jgi:hypothetical protein
VRGKRQKTPSACHTATRQIHASKTSLNSCTHTKWFVPRGCRHVRHPSVEVWQRQSQPPPPLQSRTPSAYFSHCVLCSLWPELGVLGWRPHVTCARPVLHGTRRKYKLHPIHTHMVGIDVSHPWFRSLVVRTVQCLIASICISRLGSGTSTGWRVVHNGRGVAWQLKPCVARPRAWAAQPATTDTPASSTFHTPASRLLTSACWYCTRAAAASARCLLQCVRGRGSSRHSSVGFR